MKQLQTIRTDEFVKKNLQTMKQCQWTAGKVISAFFRVYFWEIIHALDNIYTYIYIYIYVYVYIHVYVYVYGNVYVYV